MEMTDWSANLLTVRGESIKILEMVDLFDSEGKNAFDFEKIVPIPQELVSENGESSKELGDWLLEHWGTWYNPGFASFVHFDDKLEISFSTSYGPSFGITKALAKKYPHLSFKHQYVFEGCEAGLLECDKGMVTKEVEVGDFYEYVFGAVQDVFYADEEDDGQVFLEEMAKLFKLDLPRVIEISKKYPMEQWYTGLVGELKKVGNNNNVW